MSSPEDYMLPCLSKQILGMDCLGCGIQRATVYLFSGEFSLAFNMYPAIFTLFILAFFLIFNQFYKFKHDETFKITLVVLNISIIVISYIIKITN